MRVEICVYFALFLPSMRTCLAYGISYESKWMKWVVRAPAEVGPFRLGYFLQKYGN